MYWLEADASDRGVGECWTDYARRSCSEIRQQFQQLVEKTNFVKEADHWPSLQLKIEEGVDPIPSLVFVAYFVSEQELLKLKTENR